VTDPVRLVFDVDCYPEQAFRLWTDRAHMWWPRTHTSTRSSATRVVFEPMVGGRIFERRPDGNEVDWGSIVTWMPPRNLVYRWHIFSGTSDATEVEVWFYDNGDGSTRVYIEHRGRDAFPDAEERRERNEEGWHGLISAYRSACAGTAEP
jgi:Activator of Hsp90 ATPase homolog 1-like protein